MLRLRRDCTNMLNYEIYLLDTRARRIVEHGTVASTVKSWRAGDKLL